MHGSQAAAPRYSAVNPERCRNSPSIVRVLLNCIGAGDPPRLSKDRSMSSRSLNWLKFGGLVALAFALGLLFAGLLDLPNRTAAQEQGRQTTIARVPAPSIPAALPLQEFSEAFAAVAEHVKPSVVYIRSQRTESANNRKMPPGMERFFPRFRQRDEIEQGSGSGFVVSADGFILTNNHVVEGAEQVTVRLLNRREFKARVIGTDPNTDVAVLKIDAKGLPPVALGNSEDARVGEWVLAIGNPLGEGLTFTVTSGIVSAKGRALNGLPGHGQGSIQDFIQTDAAINPGNSGGPLVSVRGEVIGINSAIASQTGFYSGYGFAIPIDLARQVMDQIIAGGRVNRVAMGVSVQNATANDAEYVGLPDIRGVLVQDFSEGSPARKAGLESGDIIVAIDGRPVEYVGQLQQQIAFRKPGDKVKVEVARKGGVHKTYEVRLEALPSPKEIANADTDSRGDAASSEGVASDIDRLGLTVQPVDQDAVNQFGLKPEQRGLIVTDVTPGGPAQGEIAEPNNGGPDILLSVEGKAVKSTAELRQVLRNYKPGNIVTLRLYNTRAKNNRIERIRLGE